MLGDQQEIADEEGWLHGGGWDAEGLDDEGDDEDGDDNDVEEGLNRREQAVLMMVVVRGVGRTAELGAVSGGSAGRTGSLPALMAGLFAHWLDSALMAFAFLIAWLWFIASLPRSATSALATAEAVCGFACLGTKLLDGEAGGFLLGLLLGGAFGFGEGPGVAGGVVDADFDAEAFVVVGAALVGENVLGLAGPDGLEMLLKCGFMVADGAREGVARGVRAERRSGRAGLRRSPARRTCGRRAGRRRGRGRR